MKADDVIDQFWPYMNADQIIRCSNYMEGDIERNELIETISKILTLIH